MMAHTITVHSANARIVKMVREELESKVVKVRVVETETPSAADLVVSTAAANSNDEWTAARLGCFVAVIPEAFDYIRTLLDRRGSLVLVGSDRGRR